LHYESEKTLTFNFNSETSKCLAIGQQQNINIWNDFNSFDRRSKLDTSVSNKHCGKESNVRCDDGIDVVVFNSIICERLDFFLLVHMSFPHHIFFEFVYYFCALIAFQVLY
jgi:hypothetical protein